MIISATILRNFCNYRLLAVIPLIGRIALKILTGKPTGKGPLERPRHRWEDNIIMDLKRNRYQYEELG